MHVRKDFGHEVLKPMSTIFCRQACSGRGAGLASDSFQEISDFSGEMLKREIFVFLWFAPLEA
jgi:hypothetical protein